MSQDDKKRAAAMAALAELKPEWIIGVGTGSTTDHFIDALAERKRRIVGAVASSERSAERLRQAGIRLLDLNDVEQLPVYVDGADEATRSRELVKGGGGALTREKVIASAAQTFICVVDDSKLVERLGVFPLPVEVLPMAVRQVARRIATLGARPTLREGFTTDNGNRILDVHGLRVDDAGRLEDLLNQIPGVVENGFFSRRRADLLLVGGEAGVTRIS
jgi:ribose 5-phosphate isomerase A